MEVSCTDSKSVLIFVLLFSCFARIISCKNVLLDTDSNSIPLLSTSTATELYDEFSTIMPSFDASLTYNLMPEITHTPDDDYIAKDPSLKTHLVHTSYDGMSNLLSGSFPLSSSETKIPVTHAYGDHFHSSFLPASQSLEQNLHNDTDAASIIVQNSSLQLELNKQDLENDSFDLNNIDKSSWQQTQEESDIFGDNFKVDLNPDTTQHYALNEKECNASSIKGTSGIIYVVNNRTVPYWWTCIFKITVPAGYFIAARVEVIQENCLYIHNKLIAFFMHGYDNWFRYTCHDETRLDSMLFTPNNEVLFYMEIYTNATNITMFYIFFTTVDHDGRHVLPVFKSSPTAGYITSAGFGGKGGLCYFTYAVRHLSVPIDHILMISFPYMDLTDILCNSSTIHLTLYKLVNGTTPHRQSRVCSGGLRPQLFSTDLIVVLNTSTSTTSGFKMKYSFHQISEAPMMHDNEMLDCSTPTYNSFKHHVHCNLVTECAGAEDEGGHCWFSSQPCNGGVAVGNGCYKSFQNKHLITWLKAAQSCHSLGGVLAGMNTAEDRQAAKTIFEHGKGWTPVWMGLRRVHHLMPHMYWKMWMWADDVVAYTVDIYRTENLFGNIEDGCAFVTPPFFESLCASNCENEIADRYFCKFRIGEKAELSSNNAVPPDLAHKFSTLWSRYPMTKCPSGHVTYSFMSCDPDSGCKTKYQTSCTTYHERTRDIKDTDKIDVNSLQKTDGDADTLRDNSDSNVLTSGRISISVSLFACVAGEVTVPYSLVCDYVPDCSDGSDESFCRYFDRCREHTCDSGQCFSSSQKCDRIYDCQDRSDERLCWFTNTEKYFSHWTLNSHFRRLPPPTIIDFDGQGDFKQRPMRVSEACPETHFRCSVDGESHCLPVYVRCNGVYDCAGREDEENCDRYTCPGFYRCRGSRICLHVDHVCDGWPQCPKRDDELYCGLICPQGCMCQGLAFVCPVKISPSKYTDIRYLDARYSKMNLIDVLDNMYLVWLDMAFNNINKMSNLTWPNLMHLDVSDNNIATLNLCDFLSLPSLKTLILSGNPLVSFVHDSVSLKQTHLQYLDISKTLLRNFDSSVLTCHSQIRELNISQCPLDKLTGTFLKSTPRLSILDLSGSPVSEFPRDIFVGLNQLKTLFSENYKLCCKVFLPESFDDRHCFAPQDGISSCDDLLRSNLYRACLWVFAALAVVGNLGCFIFRIFSRQNNSRNSFNVFVTNLTVADFLMGVYLAMVGVADEIYRGQYVWYETTWKNNTVCALAGFLSLLSSETSALTICLITLDRFIVLKFPLSSVRFSSRSSAFACGLIWVLGISLACVPFFPMTPRWDFYGQTGICIPLPITRNSFPGHSYAFGIMIYFNFFLFVLIALGQVSIYWSVRVNSLVVNSTKKSQDLIIARRLFTVAASDFLCWFPIGLLGFLSNNGMHVPSEVNVALAIAVLPLNSALNPFLYTFNMMMEKRTKAREAYLLKMFQKKMSIEMFTKLQSNQSKTMTETL